MLIFIVIVGVSVLIFILYEKSKDSNQTRIDNPLNKGWITDDLVDKANFSKEYNYTTGLFKPKIDEIAPEIIKIFRDKYKGKQLNRLMRMFVLLSDEIQNNEKIKDYRSLLMNCSASLPLIEPSIVVDKKEGNIKDIANIRAIEKGLVYNAIFEKKEQIIKIDQIVNYFPELHHYKLNVKKAFIILNLVPRICEYVKLNPNCVQTDLKKQLAVDDGKIISNAIHYLEKINRIRIVKNVGKIYLKSV